MYNMVNAWSLLGSIMDGTLDEDYPTMEKSNDFGVSIEGSNNGVYSIYDPNVALNEDVTVGTAGNIELGIDSNKISCKYEEDVILDKAKDYISGTYRGHYTTEGSNIQTLDLIESVGDAEAFCRSNAIKYLSRYDKKGFPQKDILKAVHYCVLLYHFTSKPVEISEPYETF
tara:strand:- start:856 stop:1368 length:513 start_codon:yes stop_codon:yes gene_type:complete